MDRPINMATVAIDVSRGAPSAQITKLRRALSGLLELVEAHGIEPCRDFEPHKFEAVVDFAVQDARRALAETKPA